MISEISTNFFPDRREEDSHVFSEDECSLQADVQDNSNGHHSDPNEVEYFSESFSVKESFWGTKYQDALKKAIKLTS